MLLSIVIPTYNKEKQISRCIESLMQIRELEVEFIIVNDGSSDGTVNICEKYEKLDSRIRLLTQKNTGVSGARNTGIECSLGKYIGFVDADDEVTEQFNEVIEVIKKNEADIYGFAYYELKNSSKKKCSKPWMKPGFNGKQELYNSILSGLCNSVWSNIYRADIIREQNIRFRDGMVMGEDCEFNSNYVKYCTKSYYIDEIGYKYYVDDSDSATHKRELRYLKDFEQMYKALLSVYQLEDNLEFPFDCELYIRLVYGIIKKNIKIITAEENRAFRTGLFYKKIITYRCENKKTNLKKWFIRSNLYRIFRL